LEDYLIPEVGPAGPHPVPEPASPHPPARPGSRTARRGPQGPVERLDWRTGLSLSRSPTCSIGPG